MSKELVISANRHETRVAVIEDDQVVEVYHQRENEYSLAGSIHKGRVTRVLPGMQSAFVDIGLGRDAFLYVSDFFEDNEEYDKIVTSVEEKVLKLDRTPAPQATPSDVQPAAAETAPAVEDVAETTPESASPGLPPGPAPSAAPGVASGSAPVSAAVPHPVVAPPDHRRDGRDGRGRRSRRRRGQKGGGGRGLPDSKFYSPRPEGSPESRLEPPSRVESEPLAAAPVPESVDDDFFVLPGESLAKYTGPAGTPEEFVEEPAVEDGDEAEEPEVATEPAVEMPVEAVAEPEPEPNREAVAQPEPQPEPEPEVVAVLESAAEKLDEPAAEAQAPLESADSVEEPLAEAAVAAERADAEAEAASEIEAGEATELAVEADGEGEPIVEPEGPEPARIPTSLTAALREQNPRYLQHRVSRRMRRKGGRPDERGPRPEGGRPPQGEPRTPEGRGDARPEQRSEQRMAPNPRGGEARQEKALPSISDLLKEGQEIIVQIAKEPLGQKGARITSHIALPGRFLVYMPTVDHIGVSRKIPSDDERLRLKRVLQSNRTGIPGGYIVRTAGDGRTEEELRADMMFLYNLWLDMRQKAERRPAPLLIHHDLNVVERILRDQLTSSFKNIWVDNEEVYEGVLGFVQRFQPAMVGRVKLYTRTTPIFDEFNITSELEKALRPKVWLKSGGYIVINQTEALVAIDINTGKYVGKSNRLEDTIVKTNTDAIKEIVRQIRLRDLGGIIVVDFIDMDERKNRQKVMQTLEEAMRADRAPYKILQFNDFGLVAITRKRVKQSLERTLCTPCPYCEGAGYVKSPQTVVGEILQEAYKISRAVEGRDVLLRVSPEVAKLLKSNQNSYLQEIEEILGGRTVIVKSDSQLHQEKFDLA